MSKHLRSRARSSNTTESSNVLCRSLVQALALRLLFIDFKQCSTGLKDSLWLAAPGTNQQIQSKSSSPQSQGDSSSARKHIKSKNTYGQTRGIINS